MENLSFDSIKNWILNYAARWSDMQSCRRAVLLAPDKAPVVVILAYDQKISPKECKFLCYGSGARRDNRPICE